MALSIFTPVAGSTVEFSSDWFGDRNFTGKWRAVTVAAGTHLLIQNFGCYPIRYSLTQPATDADLKSGLPIVEGPASFVVPRTAATIYISFPDGDSHGAVTVGIVTNPL